MTENLKASSALNPTHANACEVDTEKYGHYVEDLDLTQDQKTELLQTLWSLMCAFVDLGFGVDSVQRLFPDLLENPSETAEEPVELDHEECLQAFDGTAPTDRRG